MMTGFVKDKDTLELAYMILASVKEPEKIVSIKKDIRRYYKEQSEKATGYEVFGDYDSYRELIPVPEDEVDRREDWFNEEIRRVAYPSQYDCTGQHFTIGRKFVMFRNRLHCIHHVCVDV